MIGVYKILNTVNNKPYIGSSVNIATRWGKHKSLLRYDKHENMKLQNAWNKYGEEAFVFLILEECEIDELLIREQYYLDQLGAQEFLRKENRDFDEVCYNISCIANTCFISDEVRNKINNTLREKRELGLIKKTNTKKCYQYNRFTGSLIKEWDVINDANRHYKTPNKTTSVIQRNLWGETTSAFDSYWSFEPVEFVWARAPQKRSTLIVQDVIEKTYSFFDSVPIFLEAIGLNPNSRITITKCIENKTIFKNRYFCFKITAPIIYDGKPFELLGSREDIITKTDEEILNGNVKNIILCDNQQPIS